MLPPHLERIREKLAENIHELWVMNKIELGWTYGAVSIRGRAAKRFQKGVIIRLLNDSGNSLLLWPVGNGKQVFKGQKSPR